MHSTSCKRYFFLLSIIVIISVIIGTESAYRLSAFCLFLVCLVFGGHERIITNPFLFFSITPLTLACYTSISDVYMLELSGKTWILCIINIYAFFLSLVFTPRFKKISNCVGLQSNYLLKKHAIILYGLSMLEILLPVFDSILWLFRVAAFVCLIKTKEIKSWIIVLALIVITIATGKVSKMEILLDVLLVLICYVKYYSFNAKNKLKLIILLSAAIIIMVGSFIIPTKGQEANSSEESYLYYSSRVDWNLNTALFLPYMYLETPWSNVEYVVQTQDNRTRGMWMIKPLLGYLGMDDKYQQIYKLEPYSSFNTFTFVTPGFKDFGLWFSVIPSLLLGFFVKKVYTRYLISKSPFDIACFITVSLATIEMFFSNHFYMQSYPFTIIILMELYKIFVIRIEGKQIELELLSR